MEAILNQTTTNKLQMKFRQQRISNEILLKTDKTLYLIDSTTV